MANFFHPDAVNDVLDALIERGARRLSADTQRRLRGLLLRHVRDSEHECVPVKTLPHPPPPWAEGKVLHHLLPSNQLQAEVRRTAFFLSRAEEELTLGKLAASDPGLHGGLQTLLKSIPHHTWPELLLRCQQHQEDLLTWRRAQVRAWPRGIVAVGRRRRWRRLRSGQELWDAAAGTIWCVRKGESHSAAYVEAIHDKALALWVLEDGVQSLALLRYDPEEGEVVEVKDRWNEPPVRYRQAVRKLLQHLGPLDTQRSSDLRALAFDPELGKRGQAYWAGELIDRRATSPLHFRLWADGRKGSYLLGLSESEQKSPLFRLRLSVKGSQATLEGMTPPDWTASEAALMLKVIGLVTRKDPRDHWHRAACELRALSRRRMQDPEAVY